MDDVSRFIWLEEAVSCEMEVTAWSGVPRLRCPRRSPVMVGRILPGKWCRWPNVTNRVVIQAHRILCPCFVWCSCMAINVSVQHNGRFLPDIILLTPMLLPLGNPSKCHEELGLCSLWSHLNVLTLFHLTGGCSEGLDEFTFSYKQGSMYLEKYYFGETKNELFLRTRQRPEILLSEPPRRFGSATAQTKAPIHTITLKK